MASACDSGELAAWDGGDHTLGGIGSQNVTLSAVDEERGALQALYGLPQPLGVTLARTVWIAEDLVYFPGPCPARELAHAVAQALTDIVQRTPGIEAMDVGHSGIQGEPFLRTNQAADIVDARLLDFWTNVNEDEGFYGRSVDKAPPVA